MSGYTMALYLAGLRSIPHGTARSCPDRRRKRISDLSSYHPSAAFPRHTLRTDHPRSHVAQGLRPDRGGGRQTTPLDVPAIYMWQTTFDGLFYGRGAAIGILLLISVAVLIIPYIRYTLKTEAQS